MSTTDERIEKFRTMAEANPNDELAHMSLGRALLEADDADGAARAFQRVLVITPKHSKTYQLLATAQFKLERKEEALETLKTGARVANERGDLMPRNEMVRILKEHGIELPELAARAVDVPVGAGEIICKRCGEIKPKMAKAPFSHPQGQVIWNNTCAKCWQEWIGMGTKVINELRLPLNDPQASKIYDQHMLEFLNLKPE